MSLQFLLSNSEESDSQLVDRIQSGKKRTPVSKVSAMPASRFSDD
jgi:hypothetical protein